MPRPKKTSGTPHEWDVRVTPTDGNEIEFTPNQDDFEIFVACREGGEGTNKRLHYHVYIKTIRSETWLRKYFSILGRATETITGNAVYKMGQAHEGTIGYVVKEGDVKCRLGWTDMFLEEMIRKSNQYRKDKEAERKRASRGKENCLAEIMKVVAEGVKNDPSPTPRRIMGDILHQYNERQIRFPNRSTLENCVMTILYKSSPTMVEEYYLRNIEPRQFNF